MRYAIVELLQKLSLEPALIAKCGDCTPKRVQFRHAADMPGGRQVHRAGKAACELEGLETEGEHWRSAHCSSSRPSQQFPFDGMLRKRKLTNFSFLRACSGHCAAPCVTECAPQISLGFLLQRNLSCGCRAVGGICRASVVRSVVRAVVLSCEGDLDGI